MLLPNSKVSLTLAVDGTFNLKFIYEELRNDFSKVKTKEDAWNPPRIWINHFPEGKLLFVWEPEGATDKKDFRMCDLLLDPPETGIDPKTMAVARYQNPQKSYEVSVGAGSGRLSIYKGSGYLHNQTDNGVEIVPGNLAECKDGLVPFLDDKHYEDFQGAPLVGAFHLQMPAMRIQRYQQK